MCDVSIIVPMYNVSAFLDRSFASLLGQTKQEGIEYIFVDDCSSDDTVEKLKSLIKNYQLTSFKLIEHTINRGSAAARNAGLDVSSGKYVGWLDADDWIEPPMFDVLYKEAEAKQLDLVSCDYYLNYESQELEMIQINRARETFMLDLLQGHVQGMLWNKLFRRSLIEHHNIRFLDGFNMAEDRNFLFKYLYYANHIGHINQVFYHYAQTSSSAMTRDYSIKRIEDEIANDGDISTFIKSHDIHFISAEVVGNFLFRAKKRLLFSRNLRDIKKWVSTYPETNNNANIHTLFIYHRMIASLALKERWSIIQFILFLKKLLK